MSKEERRTKGKKEKKEEKEGNKRGRGKEELGLNPWPPCMSNGMSDPLLPQHKKWFITERVIDQFLDYDWSNRNISIVPLVKVIFGGALFTLLCFF